MSLVITTMSYRSRIDLQSISTSVVFPAPTGPPIPTRRGGLSFVRLFMPEGPEGGISPQRHRGRQGASTKVWKQQLAAVQLKDRQIIRRFLDRYFPLG